MHPPGTCRTPARDANITQFAVGANGILTAQETFYTQGINPFRMISDGSGSYIYVLDHDSPVNSARLHRCGAGAATSHPAATLRSSR